MSILQKFEFTMIWNPTSLGITKAELLQECIFSLIHLFARDVLVMKKFEIEKTKPTFITSVLKVEYKEVLVSSISNFFSNKTSLDEF